MVLNLKKKSYNIFSIKRILIQFPPFVEYYHACIFLKSIFILKNNKSYSCSFFVFRYNIFLYDHHWSLLIIMKQTTLILSNPKTDEEESINSHSCVILLNNLCEFFTLNFIFLYFFWFICTFDRLNDLFRLFI